MAEMLNQFAISNKKGVIKNGDHGERYEVQAYVADDGAALVPGTVVKLKDGATGVPQVEVISATTDIPFGVVPYGAIYNEINNNQVFTVASDYTIITMEASAAIARGAKVMPVIAGAKVATATATNYAIGIAWDKAAAAGDIIRVLLKKPELVTA